MTGDYNFWDNEIWKFVITVSLLFGSMMLANFMRRKIKVLNDTLLPSSVLGGFIALFGNSAYYALFGESLFLTSTLEVLTYHGLGLGFIALAWRHLDGIRGRRAKRDVFNTATVTVGGYLIQGIVGVGITIVLFYIIGTFYSAGALLPMGYGQGPGQAFNWGATYEVSYGFKNGASFGLTIAAMGFISASIGGVIFLNSPGCKEKYKRSGVVVDNMTMEDYCKENEIPLSESMDKLTVQFGLVFLTYAVAYLSMWATYKFILLPIGGFALSTVNPLIWGFNFLIGTAWAILFKNIGNILREKGVLHREYTNTFMLNRISGLMFDIMVVSSIAAIDLSAFKYKEYWIAIFLVCISGALLTYLYTRKMCAYLFPKYSDEMFLTMYGMLTGTASTGVILLREIDPLFRTQASHNLIYQNLWAIVLGAPMLLMMGILPKSINSALICLVIMIALFGIITLLQFRNSIFKKMRRKKRAALREAKKQQNS